MKHLIFLFIAMLMAPAIGNAQTLSPAAQKIIDDALTELQRTKTNLELERGWNTGLVAVAQSCSEARDNLTVAAQELRNAELALSHSAGKGTSANKVIQRVREATQEEFRKELSHAMHKKESLGRDAWQLVENYTAQFDELLTLDIKLSAVIAEIAELEWEKLQLASPPEELEDKPTVASGMTDPAEAAARAEAARLKLARKTVSTEPTALDQLAQCMQHNPPLVYERPTADARSLRTP